jgi:hypothetical protein
MTVIGRVAATVGIATILLIAAPNAPFADEPTVAKYGLHARDCAQTMGFTGEHNPGMHQGFAGWDGMTCDQQPR